MKKSKLLKLNSSDPLVVRLMLNEIDMYLGKWIVAVFVLFAMFIGTLVTICVRQDISLVSTNYYQEELQYENQVERLSNTERLAVRPQIKIENRVLEIDFNQTNAIEKGMVKLFCPSNPQQDKSYRLTETLNTQTIDLHSIHGGMYRVKLYWEMNGKQFFQEKVIYI